MMTAPNNKAHIVVFADPSLVTTLFIVTLKTLKMQEVMNDSAQVEPHTKRHFLLHLKVLEWVQKRIDKTIITCTANKTAI